MSAIIDYIMKNKEWIFSGIGVLALTGVIWFLRRFLFSNSFHIDRGSGSRLRHELRSNSSEPQKSTSIPLGLQSFSFEYGPQGHTKELTLKGTIVRADIQFTCQITNPYKAMFGANEYALNVLSPRFLLEARGILEKFPLTTLRADRQEISQDIMARLSPQFEELGERMKSVTIGALDKIKRAN